MAAARTAWHVLLVEFGKEVAKPGKQVAKPEKQVAKPEKQVAKPGRHVVDGAADASAALDLADPHTHRPCNSDPGRRP